MRRLAEYYSTRPPAHAQTPAKSEDRLLEIGQALTTTGLPEQGIPSCNSCHAQDPALRNPLYPSLAGQYAAYTAQQLGLFKSGRRRNTPAAEIMSVIAQRLSVQQIDAVSLYLSSLPPGSPAGIMP